ncbi:MAG: hypothetical protein OEY55_05245 [Acidimicrobiia bacterium]|nr:hypothetical protein [Acidimicrobiia bacterium]
MSNPLVTTVNGRVRAVALVSVLALGLAACGQGDVPLASPTTAPSTTSTAAETTTTTEAPPVTTTTAAPEASTTTTVPVPAVVLAVAPDGLMLVDSETGSTTALLFGTPQDDVVAAVDSTLGETGVVNPGNVECPNGQIAVGAWKDIQLEFDAEGLMAWSLNPGSAVTDMMGVGVGSTLAEVQAGWNITIFESTLGTEFNTDVDGQGIGGLLSDASDTAVVVAYWAGFVCTFR